jgi:Zn-dependent protease
MDIISLVFYFLVIIPSSIIHEYAHGWMANQLGDPTAKYMGRLTVNPLAHIDLWGTILLPIFLLYSTGGQFMFAYAKPVPFNPYNLRNQKWGPTMVAVVGPLANLLLAVSFAIVLRVLPASSFTLFLETIIRANIGLMVFNLVPIPPLDGSKVLFGLLPPSTKHIQVLLERYGIFILLFFMVFLFDLIRPIIQGIFSLLVGY